MAAQLLADRTRLAKVVARMNAGDDGAVPAFTLLSRALSDSGHNWSDVFAAWLAHRDSIAPQTSPSPRAAAPKRDDIGDWLRDVDAAMSKPKGFSARPVLQGDAIPERMSGAISILGRRTTRYGKPMLIVTVESSTAIASPITVFDAALVAGIEDGSILTGLASIKPAPAAHLNPVLTAFSDVRQTAEAA